MQLTRLAFAAALGAAVLAAQGTAGKTHLKVGDTAPDFTFASLRGNAVLRWEFAPGSTMYLVWTQDRAYSDGSGEFQARRSFSRLLDEPGRNVLMLKMSYWLSG